MHFLSVSLGWHPDVVGGAWRVAAAQAAGLAARDHTVEAVTLRAADDAPASEVRGGVRIHRFAAPRAAFPVRWRAANRAAAAVVAERLAAASDPVLVLQHHAYLQPALAHVNAPVLHVFHGPWAEEYRAGTARGHRGPARRLLDIVIPVVLRRVESRSLRRARRILVLSRHFARRLPGWHPGPLPPIEVVPGGVDFRRFDPAPDRVAVRAGWGLPGDEFLWVATRRLEPRMGLDRLLEAFGAVAREFPRARLWLTGNGSAEGDLRAQARRLGLLEVVRFLGVLPEPDLARLLNAADAAVVPSLNLEGFGLATAEALACGTPVIGSDAGATPELLEPLDPALVFAAGSVDALRNILATCMRRPDRLPDRARCAAYARERFAWDSQVDACERAAREFLGGAARA